MKVFAKAGYPLKAHLEYGIYEIEMAFGKEDKDSV